MLCSLLRLITVDSNVFSWLDGLILCYHDSKMVINWFSWNLVHNWAWHRDEYITFSSSSSFLVCTTISALCHSPSATSRAGDSEPYWLEHSDSEKNDSILQNESIFWFNLIWFSTSLPYRRIGYYHLLCCQMSTLLRHHESLSQLHKDVGCDVSYNNWAERCYIK